MSHQRSTHIYLVKWEHKPASQHAPEIETLYIVAPNEFLVRAVCEEQLTHYLFGTHSYSVDLVGDVAMEINLEARWS